MPESIDTRSHVTLQPWHARPPSSTALPPSDHVRHDGGHLAAVGASRTTAHHHQQHTRALHGKVRCVPSRGAEPRKRHCGRPAGASVGGQSGAAGPHVAPSRARARCVAACTAAGLALGTGSVNPGPMQLHA